MLRRIIPLSFIVLITISCSTIPGPVDDKYLVDATGENKVKLKNLEDKIIKKNTEQKLSEEKLRLLLPQPDLFENEINLIEKDKNIINKELEYYSERKDEKNEANKKDELQKIEESLKIKRKLLGLKKLEKKYAETEVKLKNAELALYVAEWRFEKSKIAAIYRDKTEPAPVKKEDQGFIDKYILQKDPDDRYGYKKYEIFYNDKMEELNKAKEYYIIAESDYLKEKKIIENVK